MSSRLVAEIVSRPPPNPRGSGGVTLLEIMMASMVMVIGLLGVLGMMNYGHRGTQKDFRSLTALQILQDRTNQLSQLSYASLTLQLSGLETEVTGPVYGIPLGPVKEGDTTYTTTCFLRHMSVSMWYRPLNIAVTTPVFKSDDSDTWRFGAVTNADAIFDGSSADHPYKVIRLRVLVKWVSLIGKVNRSYEAVTFVVDLEN